MDSGVRSTWRVEADCACQAAHKIGLESGNDIVKAFLEGKGTLSVAPEGQGPWNFLRCRAWQEHLKKNWKYKCEWKGG